MSDTIYVECLGFVFNKDAAININTECGLLTNSELNEILTEEESSKKIVMQPKVCALKVITKMTYYTLYHDRCISVFERM